MFTIQPRPGFTVIVMAKTPKKTKAEVDRRVSRGLCLQCDKAAEKGKRGLCGVHYWRRYHTLGGLTEDARAARDAKDIRDGKILKSNQGKRPVERSA